MTIGINNKHKARTAFTELQQPCTMRASWAFISKQFVRDFELHNGMTVGVSIAKPRIPLDSQQHQPITSQNIQDLH
jgi:hypothetical protein